MTDKSPFDAIFDGNGLDPIEAAQKHMRADLPKRFWTSVDVSAADTGFTVKLDGRPARTPGKKVLQSRYRSVAEAMAAEWRNVDIYLDPVNLPVTRLINVAVDYADVAEEKLIEDVTSYASSDLLCYRADHPQGLVERQEAVWDPYLRWLSQTHSCQLQPGAGIMPVTQQDGALAALSSAARLSAKSPETRAALHLATTLTGSAVLALSLFEQTHSSDDVWDAAHLDENWNRDLWGFDAEADAARKAKKRDFDAAAFVIGASRQG